MNPHGAKSAVDKLGEKTIRLAKYYNLMVFILDQHVPETKGQDFEKRLLELSKKITKLSCLNDANDMLIKAIEKKMNLDDIHIEFLKDKVRS